MKYPSDTWLHRGLNNFGEFLYTQVQSQVFYLPEPILLPEKQQDRFNTYV